MLQRPTQSSAGGARGAPSPPPSNAAGRSKSARPGWSPPRSINEKDHLIEKLVHDNEILMKEVAELDAQLQQVTAERDHAVASRAQLLADQEEAQSGRAISERLANAMEAQMETVRSEREELARQHAADRDFLNGMFTELEAQLALARTEREELRKRAERERGVAAKRMRELEEALSAAQFSKDKLREQCDREKEVLAKQFEQRVAGLRLEKEQAKLDKALMRRLETDLTELKQLSSSVLGPMADQRERRPPPYGDPASALRSRDADFELTDPEVEAHAAYLSRAARS